VSGFTFTKAVKRQEKLRMALDGPSGAGKTWTSLLLGSFLAEQEGGRIALIDSERGSARKYADYFDFDHLELPDFSPHTYTAAIRAAIAEGYPVLIVDSLSHAWEGTLDLKDQVAKRSRTGDSFGAWREVTPVHNELVDVMLRARAHVIVTMRTKTEYLVEKDDATGKNRITKLGLKPVQRDGVEYEFDVVGDLDLENTLTVSKSRCHELAGSVVRKPGANLAETLWKWLNTGEPLITAEVAESFRARLNALSGESRAVFRASFGSLDGIPESQVAAAEELIAEHEAARDGAAPVPELDASDLDRVAS
jgi:hypothetical protein